MTLDKWAKSNFHRIIGGKEYDRHYKYANKKVAEVRVSSLRKHKVSARLIKTKDGLWSIFVRR